MIKDPTANFSIPALVQSVKASREARTFARNCTDACGHLLRTLVPVEGPILEVGTGVGVETAWLASGTDANIISCELDPATAAVARKLTSSQTNISIVTGTLQDIEATGFTFAFIDIASLKDNGEPVIQRMKAGGTIVMDDFTPDWLKTGDLNRSVDQRKNFWFTHPQFSSTEVLVTADTSALICVKKA